ncbi:glycosyltransferase family 4 protein [Alteribacter keqinensis]|uniref:Glycosyltransferase family 1 protein n=1 Tax=Alteribacter keqinensis TaxID=2483800 RepID=A0A3M7TWL4_9BACI|nr:glycosyltransferase family 4 protein [Alteribacter keqinensis]RNA69873.1 glycosyltransferase family 1 protein [Alteribacter keqinensis]
MKIAIICTEKLPIPPIRGGAIQTYIAGALPSLKRHHDITVYGRSDEALADRETADGVKYIRVPGGLLETYRDGIAAVLKEETYDVIHIFNRPRLVEAVRNAAPKSRLILSMHNDMFKREKISPEEGAAAVAQVDKIITISDYIGQSIVKDYPEAAPKLKTIYSGVDLNQFVPASTSKGKQLRDAVRSEHNLGSKKVIMFAGRLSANKGADVLLEAIPILAKKHSDIALVLVGSKWFSDNNVTDYVAYVRALAQRMPVPVITTGFVDPNEIQRWFAAADVFVCPSQWQEPLARVHYEAMAAGLPIVTTARGGNPEVIDPGVNGFVIENPENPQEFADKLSQILGDPGNAQKMGANGRKLAEERFQWIRVVSDILTVWKEMAHNIETGQPLGLGEGAVPVESAEVEPLEAVEVIEIDEVAEIVEQPEHIYKYTNNPPSSPKLFMANQTKQRKRRVS